MGTEGNDLIQLQLLPSGGAEVFVNGDSLGVLHFTTGTVNGLGGIDTLEILGTAQADNFVLGSSLGLPSYQFLEGSIEFEGIETSRILGGQGDDNFEIGSEAIGDLLGEDGDDRYSLADSQLAGRIDGGIGANLLSYRSAVVGATVNLTTGIASRVAQGIVNISRVEGGLGNDVLTGNSSSNTFIASAGSDIVDGGTGSDTFESAGQVNRWKLTTANGGTAAIGSSVTTFNNIETLVGGNSLAGRDVANQWKMSSPSVGSIGTLTFQDVGQLEGGTALDTLTGPSSLSSHSWLFDGINSGQIGTGSRFQGMENITGGTSNDTFVFATGAGITGTLSGGTNPIGGGDTIDFSIRDSAVNVDLRTSTASQIQKFTGIENITGTSFEDLFRSGDVANTWSLSGVHSGSVAKINFTSFESLQGGAGNDTFNVLTGSTESKLDGGSGTDVVAGPNSNNLWLLSADRAGLLNSNVEFTNIESLKGNALIDQFVVNPSATGFVAVSGGNGSDVLDYSGLPSSISVNLATSSSPGIATFSTIELILGTSGIDTVTGPNLATTWSISGPDIFSASKVQFESFENISAGNLKDTFNITSTTASLTGTLTGGGDVDTLKGFNANNVWELSGNQSGQLPGVVHFSGVENLTGGTAADSFQAGAQAAGFGILSGGSGADTVDLSAVLTPVVVDLSNSTISGIGNLSAIELIIGTSGSDTLRGPNLKTAWTVNPSGTSKVGATSFSSFEQLLGGSNNDAFTMASMGPISISGGAGLDSLIGSSSPANWVVGHAGGGSINGIASFNDFENLTGGAGDDLFKILPSGSVQGTLSGGLGVNTLSYADWNTGVTVNATVGVATSVNLLSPTFQVFVGGSGNDQLVAFSTVATVLIGNAGNDTLTGGTARDILFGGLGSDTLNGGGNEDIIFGGVSAFDDQPNSIKAIRAEWLSTRKYAERVNNLRGGPITGSPLNNGNFLSNFPVDTLLNDEASDSLTGGLLSDWFIKSIEDNVADLAVGEFLDNSGL